MRVPQDKYRFRGRVMEAHRGMMHRGHGLRGKRARQAGTIHAEVQPFTVKKHCNSYALVDVYGGTKRNEASGAKI